MTLSGKGVLPGSRFTTSDALDSPREQEQRHVADDLRRGRHLDDVAEQLIHVGVRARDLRPPVRDRHRHSLLLQVRVLPAGHLVQIDLGGSGRRRRVERPVELADVPPSSRNIGSARRGRAPSHAACAAARRPRSSDSAATCCRSSTPARIGNVHAASAALSTEAEATPLVSCVWK